MSKVKIKKPAKKSRKAPVKAEKKTAKKSAAKKTEKSSKRRYKMKAVKKTFVCNDCGRTISYTSRGGRNRTICSECASLQRHGKTFKQDRAEKDAKMTLEELVKDGAIQYESTAIVAIEKALPRLPREVAEKISDALNAWKQERVRANIDGILARAEARRRMERPVETARTVRRIRRGGNIYTVESRSGLGWGCPSPDLSDLED